MKKAETIIRRADELIAAEPKAAEPIHSVPLVHRLLAQRGMESARELDFALADLPSFDTLPNIVEAIDRLEQALVQQQRILIIGDYDCDGATSTALALLALQQMGVEHVDYLVPNRFDYGYGLSAAIVEVAKESSPDLIVTVDNGVASNEGVARASELGIDVVVTDHHLPPDTLPAACAIVNPNLPGSHFPSGALAGVGVIFYVMLALRARLNQSGYFDADRPEPRLAELLDLVAIGTVADVVPLDKINRTLVEQGIRRIRAGNTRPGVMALCDVAGRQAPRLAATDIGFALAPRLNAAGRLDDISVGIQCLLAQTSSQASNLASDLNALNQDRRNIEHGMRKEADVLVSRTLAALPKGQSVMSLCLYEPHWHQGVIGILAGRLKEELNIPVIVFAAEDGTDATSDPMLKGSGRSIAGLHIRDAMMAVAAHAPGLLKKFGGHAMAAGLSLAHSDLGEFARAFDNEVRVALDHRQPTREWLTDGALVAEDFTLANAELLRFICPWGQDFAEPMFDGRFTVVSWRVLKERHMKFQLQPEGTELVIDAIAFNQQLDDPVGNTFQMVFRLEVNTFRNQQSLQLQVLYIVS